jgi:hypothetical protein
MATHIKKSKNDIKAAHLNRLKSQSPFCHICRMQFTDEVTCCVDHNHETGELRGLLCISCNAAIGMFKENIQFLKNAIEYLRRYGPQDYDPDDINSL